MFYDVTDSAYSTTNRMFGVNDFNSEVTNRIKEYTDSIVENEIAIQKAESELDNLNDKQEEAYTSLKTLQ